MKYRLGEIDETRCDGQIFIKGAQWANADENHAKYRFRKFRKSPHKPVEWAVDLREKLIDQYSQSAINLIYDEKLGAFFGE